MSVWTPSSSMGQCYDLWTLTSRRCQKDSQIHQDWLLGPKWLLPWLPVSDLKSLRLHQRCERMIHINYSGQSADARSFLLLGEPSNTAELQPHLHLGAQPCLALCCSVRLRDSADAGGQTGLETISAASAAAIWEDVSWRGRRGTAW